jgi:hypothetical protein
MGVERGGGGTGQDLVGGGGGCKVQYGWLVRWTFSVT